MSGIAVYIRMCVTSVICHFSHGATGWGKRSAWGKILVQELVNAVQGVDKWNAGKSCACLYAFAAMKPKNFVCSANRTRINCSAKKFHFYRAICIAFLLNAGALQASEPCVLSCGRLPYCTGKCRVSNYPNLLSKNTFCFGWCHSGTYFCGLGARSFFIVVTFMLSFYSTHTHTLKVICLESRPWIYSGREVCVGGRQCSMHMSTYVLSGCAYRWMYCKRQMQQDANILSAFAP